jgi:excisionase family DNA binding protein
MMKGYLTVKEAAERLQLEPSSVRRLVTTGRLPGKKQGRFWVVREKDVAAFKKLPPGTPGDPSRLKARH